MCDFFQFINFLVILFGGTEEDWLGRVELKVYFFVFLNVFNNSDDLVFKQVFWMKWKFAFFNKLVTLEFYVFFIVLCLLWILGLGQEWLISNVFSDFF